MPDQGKNYDLERSREEEDNEPPVEAVVIPSNSDGKLSWQFMQ